ncbi:helix-turn-helix domain-containing protein [Streptomyces sp. NPDC006879]|uniref:helix-turn-helix domain-containing protein n=1 Tax=Streptomyces sp. NPDC006879 TaxID=3364767 RepID=UPI003695F77A
MENEQGQQADTMWGYGYEPEKALGEALRSLRTARGMSQEDVATMMSRSGFSWRQTTVAKTEGGSRPVRVNEAAALALCFGVSVNELLGNQADSPEQSLIESTYRVSFSLYLSTRLRTEEALRRKEAAEREYEESLAQLRETKQSYEEASRAFEEAFLEPSGEGEEKD